MPVKNPDQILSQVTKPKRSDLTVTNKVKSIDVGSLPFVTLENKCDLPKAAGVYVVLSFTAELNGMKVAPLYVGQSINMRRRWASHHKLPKIKQYLDVRIYYLQSSVTELDEIESGLIERLQPLHNDTWIPLHG